jgi:6-phosphogluconolactonase
MAACYQTGNALVYPTGKNGALQPHKANVQHAGSSVNATRQQEAHTHFITSINNGKQLLVADLGIDSVLVYNHAEEGVTLAQTVPLPPGSGPRHIAVNPATGVAFVVNELTGTVAVLVKVDGMYKVASIAASFSSNVDITPSAAAIRVSTNGRFVYVSERADDHLSVFAFNHHTNMLTLLRRYPTMGKTPRDFILDRTNNWLLVAHQHSDDIAVFKADTTTGKLEFHHLQTGIHSPVCFAWLP